VEYDLEAAVGLVPEDVVAVRGTAATGADNEGTPGHDLNPALPRKTFDRLTALGQAAASRFNERR
jgi:hypothetical protein